MIFSSIQKLKSVLRTFSSDERKEMWQFGELLQHPELLHFTQDLGVMLDYLTEKGFVEVSQIETKGQEVYHRGYSFKKC